MSWAYLRRDSGMSLDENTYSQPHEFNPERFLDRPGKPAEPHFTVAFGFGRRSEAVHSRCMYVLTT